MSAEQNNDPATSEVSPELPVLRREALLPTERSRGLGTVAVVCTMAGIASGLALATTLMAMQVADNMSARACPYSTHIAELQQHRAPPPVLDHGFLGIQFYFHNGTAEIERVFPGTPAERSGLHVGDHVVSMDGTPISSGAELQRRIFAEHPGYAPTFEIERGDGTHDAVSPTLIAWPSVAY
jgi:S1-C subfamily serine protease